MNVEKILMTERPIPLKSRTIIHLALIQNKLNEVFVSVLKPFDVSLQQFNVLRILRGHKGKPANLSTLNERMVSKMSNTTRLVDKLLLKGYVERNVCPSNRRKIEIGITPKGMEALLKMDLLVLRAEEHMVKNFTRAELEHLNGLLDKF